MTALIMAPGSIPSQRKGICKYCGTPVGLVEKAHMVLQIGEEFRCVDVVPVAGRDDDLEIVCDALFLSDIRPTRRDAPSIHFKEFL